MLGVPAALARAQHAIAAGEARHSAMKRIETAEWEAARAFTERVLEALSPLTSKAGERLNLGQWTAAHGAAVARLAELGFAAVLTEEDEAVNPCSKLQKWRRLPSSSISLAMLVFSASSQARGKGPPRRIRIHGSFCARRSMRGCLLRMLSCLAD